MNKSLVITVHGSDRPGLVGILADVVADHGGSWQESRMANLSGQFAGILRIVCPTDQESALQDALKALAGSGLQVDVAGDVSLAEKEGDSVSLSITGHDEPGIVKTIAAVLASLEVNVEELSTTLESAPMAGHLLFCTEGEVRLPKGLLVPELIEALELVGSDLTVDVS